MEDMRTVLSFLVAIGLTMAPAFPAQKHSHHRHKKGRRAGHRTMHHRNARAKSAAAKRADNSYSKSKSHNIA
jgi:hypothetical protein